MNANHFDLTNHLCVVTGSSQGIGLAPARGMAAYGAKVVLNGRDPDKLAKAGAELRAEGVNVEVAPFDVTDRDAVAAGVDRVEQALGAIDILVNNAGMQFRAPLEDFPADRWEQLLTTNVSSVFYTGQAVARHMIARGGARSSTSRLSRQSWPARALRPTRQQRARFAI